MRLGRLMRPYARVIGTLLVHRMTPDHLTKAQSLYAPSTLSSLQLFVQLRRAA